MSYCPYCGTQVTEGMSFCPNCGASLNSEIRSYTISDTITASSGDYRIYITSLGSAAKANVIDLLEDTLGYTSVSATNLVNNIPVQIAGNLSLKQAAVIAQAFEEYGVELSVTNGDEVEDISSETSSSSLFNSDGSFLASAAVVLATLGAANRLRSLNKPKKPSLLSRIFHSLFTVDRKPPVHVRRSIRPRNLVFEPHPQPQRKTVRQQLRPVNSPFTNSRPSNAGNGSHPGSRPSSHQGPGSNGHKGQGGRRK